MMERYKLSSIGELEPTPWDRYNKQDIPEESVEVVLAIDVQAAIDAQDQKIKELEKLAYIGEHQFPDATYKARLDELVPQYRQLEKELARVKALARFTPEQLYKDWVEVNKRYSALIGALMPLRLSCLLCGQPDRELVVTLIDYPAIGVCAECRDTKQAHADLLVEAKWAMNLVQLTYCQLEHTQELTIENDLDAYRRATAFLATHEVKHD